VFAGSINPQGGYLSDPTGARRFWPVTCGSIDIKALARDRDQLCGRGLVRFKEGQPWWLETPELEALAIAEQAARYATDAWEECVHEWLADTTDSSVREVLVGAPGISQASWSQSAQNRVVKILSAMGFRKYRSSKEGHRQNRYEKVGPEL
jgi:predicted P-loop ATPase